MKRILTLALACALILSLAACGSKAPAEGGDGSAATGSGPPPESTARAEGPQRAEDTPPTDSCPAQTAPPMEAAQSAEPGSSTAASRSAANEKAQLDALWETLRGCWTATDERFAYFTYHDGAPAFWGGVWESEAVFRRGSGLVTGLTAHSEREYTVTVTYPPVEDGNAADAQETREMVWSFELDIGREDVDSTIRLNDADGVTRQYAWGGHSYDNAYDSVHDVQYASFEEISALWDKLDGCWSSEDGRFLVFDRDGEALLFREGVWEAGGGRGFGTYDKPLSTLSYTAGEPVEMVIYFPTIWEENGIDCLLPELSQVLYLDLGDLDHGRSIIAQVGYDGGWIVYHYAGDDPENAHSTW